MTMIFFRVLLFLTIIIFTACEHKLSPPVNPPRNEVLFRDVAPIFNQNCVLNGCHDLVTRQVGLALNSWENAIRGSVFGEVVVPFSPERSMLIDMIAGRGIPSMPLGGNPLSAENIAQLEEWIRQGARNDSSRIPFDDHKPRLHVAHQKGGLVSIIDLEGLQVARVVETGNAALSSELSICNDENFWYVSDRALRQVRKYENRANRLLASLDLPIAPGECVLNSAGSKLYVGSADTSDARIFVVNISNLLIKEGLTVQAGPHHLSLGSSDQQLYVAHEKKDWLTVIDTENDFIRRQFSLTTGGAPAITPQHRPKGLALSPSRNELWVSCSEDNQVRIYSSVNGALIDSVGTLAAPQQIVMSADGAKLYVPCREAERILVIDTQTRQIVKNISGHDVAKPSGCALSPDGKYVFVSSTNAAGTYRARRVSAPRGNLVVVDAARDAIVKTIETQEQPLALSVSD
jgi:DNA-binding beta-propeller fold protein YncE